MSKRVSKVFTAIAVSTSLLFFPLGICGYVVLYGGEFPLGGMIVGFTAGCVIALGLSAIALQFWAKDSVRVFAAFAAALWTFNLGWIVIGKTTPYVSSLIFQIEERTTRATPYSQPVDLDGEWALEWEDRKNGFREVIHIWIKENGNNVSGNALDSNLIPSIVSGSKLAGQIDLDIHPEYGRGFHAPVPPGTTFKGTITGPRSMEGRFRVPGQNGTWVATRTGDGTRPTVRDRRHQTRPVSYCKRIRPSAPPNLGRQFPLQRIPSQGRSIRSGEDRWGCRRLAVCLPSRTRRHGEHCPNWLKR